MEEKSIAENTNVDDIEIKAPEASDKTLRYERLLEATTLLVSGLATLVERENRILKMIVDASGNDRKTTRH